MPVNVTRREVMFNNLGELSKETADFVRDAVVANVRTIYEHEVYVPTRLYVSPHLYTYLNHRPNLEFSENKMEGIQGLHICVVDGMHKMKMVITAELNQHQHEELVSDLQLERLLS